MLIFLIDGVILKTLRKKLTYKEYFDFLEQLKKLFSKTSPIKIKSIIYKNIKL